MASPIASPFASVDLLVLDPEGVTDVVRSLVAVRLGVEPSDLAIERRCGRCGRVGHGKPSLGGEHRGAVEWSVARSAGVALLALSSRGPVGVDLEEIRAVRDPVGKAARFLGAEVAGEVARTSLAAQSQELLRVWTRAEAQLKATGIGIAGLPCLAAPTGAWLVREVDVRPGFVAAVAVRP